VLSQALKEHNAIQATTKKENGMYFVAKGIAFGLHKWIQSPLLAFGSSSSPE
jgi:hypothetical protein